MGYTINLNTKPEILDKFVINSNQNTLFQCSNWTKVKNNWDHYLITINNDNNEIVASALVLSRELILGKRLFYIPRGPVMDYKNEELVEFTLNEIKKLAKKDKAIAIVFDPKILSRRYKYENRNDNIPFENEDIINNLKKLGYKHSGYTKKLGETYQPRFIAETDVEKGYQDKLDRKTIRSINTSIKKGAEFYFGKEYLDDFAKAMHYTEERKGVALRNKEYFKNMIDVYGDDCIIGIAKLNFPKQISILENRIADTKTQLNNEDISKKQKNSLNQLLKDDEEELKKLKEDYELEKQDEIILCGILAPFNNKTMEIAYMGNNPRAMRIRASYYLYNYCIKHCEKVGIRECSFGGIEGSLDDGLTIFKSNFQMNVEEYIGEFTYVLDKFMFYMFDKAYPRIRKILNKFRK